MSALNVLQTNMREGVKMAKDNKVSSFEDLCESLDRIIDTINDINITLATTLIEADAEKFKKYQSLLPRR